MYTSWGPVISKTVLQVSKDIVYVQELEVLIRMKTANSETTHSQHDFYTYSVILITLIACNFRLGL